MTAEVSVIIAAWNVERYIERAIRSALAQKDVEVEVIVVNDASTDKTRDVVLGIGDPRVKLVDMPANSGPGAARNAGLKAATGLWVAVLDGDDEFAPERLRICLTTASQSHADIVIDNLFARYEADGTGHPLFPAAFFNQLKKLDLATFIARNTALHGGEPSLGYAKPLIRRSFLQLHKLWYETAMRVGEDYLLLAEALACGANCAIEHNAGYLYTVRAGSISHRLSLQNIERMMEGDLKLLGRYKLDDAALKAQKKRTRALAESYVFTQLVDALKRHDIKAAIEAFMKKPLAARHLWEAVWVRLSGKKCKIIKGKTILLFYKEYEADKFIKYDRYLKRILRPLYHLTHHRQKKTGFAVSFELMCRGLRKAGYDLRINDYATARKNPDYPVGVIGFPVILQNWSLPNPAVLGPSLYDHPMQVPDLFKDRRFRKYVLLANWMTAIYGPVYGDCCFNWFAGIDVKSWPDLSLQPKTYDFLIYDKVRWHHDAFEQSLIKPVQDLLDRKGYSHKLVRYKMYDHAVYKKLLSECRGMIFLCEHETQGIAYQEALASGVPILAWDNGFWADPLWKKYGYTQPAASSVPFFSPECGEKFRDFGDFEAALDRFIAKRNSYNPRAYVEKHLSMDESAKIYADNYFSLLKQS